jgi:hypothetical protein
MDRKDRYSHVDIGVFVIDMVKESAYHQDQTQRKDF